MYLRRSLCTQSAAGHRRRRQLPVKQVIKSNFSETIAEFKDSIFSSDFVAVSLQKTGGYSAPWQKLLPIDTEETAYLKAKRAAERFQVLQFSVCPFSVKASKLIANPYNFQLFPRHEVKVGMPSYSFSCQSSCLTSMAQEGFDFNACVYNGISYLSRAQESAAKVQTGSVLLNSCSFQSTSAFTVADVIFAERIKTRVKNWMNGCNNQHKTEDTLISSLRKLVGRSEIYGSRPSLTIDVCSERQVQLTSEVLKEFVNIVLVRAPAKVGVEAIQVVLTSSEEDKNLLVKEIQDLEEEQGRLVSGFREVIDLISTSQKPVVVHNSLNDFAFIHSKFLAPLPPTMYEFTSSLLTVFPHILDINHLMKEIGLFNKMNNLSSAISYLDRRFSTSTDMEVSNEEETGRVNVHGHCVMRECYLFIKLCSILKISLEIREGGHTQLPAALQRCSNMFFSSDARYPFDDDVRIWTGKSRTVSVSNLVFLWGFRSGMSAQDLKDVLCNSHDVFSEEFDVKMVDRTCAIVVFWTPGFSKSFLRIMDSGELFSNKLKDMISEGLQAADYETYKGVCKSGLWKPDLAECLDQATNEIKELSGAKTQQQEQSLICWNNDEMINLDEL
ncbi:poly(A)-specific ribonuclease PARN-like isoform X2 [Salvia miltiorrhiza]|uniref:poly(A)-specific ribonuclease PARN-like isoform X2 n=1 Tax=Salvia miltiorrhiza TaxID=226208 RepID=UPI0025ACDE7E|nr:poly(A)-specific ribonuclease PARN-like isoform X2 [Salvia miltiorrhiza]